MKWKFLLQGVQFPRWGSSGLEYGPNNLGWETGSYELRPLRGHTQNFHIFRAGVKTPACERRSLLTGISHGEPSRREIRSENRTWPGQNSATRSRLTSSRCTLERTPGSRAIGEPRTDEASAASVLWHPVPVESDELESTRGDIALCTYLSSEEVHLSLAITLSRSASPPRGEASIPRASAPALFIDRLSAPWDKNQGCLHMSKARRHRRVTLIMRSGFPLGENPLVLSHHCRGLMYSRPIDITLDAAAIRPSSLWNCLRVSDWPSLTLLTAARIDSIRAGDKRACIVVESHTTPR